MRNLDPIKFIGVYKCTHNIHMDDTSQALISINPQLKKEASPPGIKSEMTIVHTPTPPPSSNIQTVSTNQHHPKLSRPIM
jgi:hypothetical protein